MNPHVLDNCVLCVLDYDCVYCIMIHYRHGVTIVRNTQSRVLWYVYVTCVTIIRNCVLEQLLGVCIAVAAVLVLLGRFVEFASASATSCAFRATASPLHIQTALLGGIWGQALTAE